MSWNVEHDETEDLIELISKPDTSLIDVLNYPVTFKLLREKNNKVVD